jgi:hypothetical protein
MKILKILSYHIPGRLSIEVDGVLSACYMNANKDDDKRDITTSNTLDSPSMIIKQGCTLLIIVIM